MADLLNVAKIIKKPSGEVFFLDADDNLLEAICKTLQLRRPIAGGLQQKLQFNFDDSTNTDVTFETNLITYIEYSPGRYQTWDALTGIGIPDELIASKFQEIYKFLAEFVFQCCCDSSVTPSPFPYPSNTWAVWLATLNADALPKGLWIEVTAIPSQPGAIFSLFCTETNQIALGGFGQFLNADWQAVGDYSDTPILFVTNEGQWYTELELVTITYNNLAGGSFAPSETITEAVTGATAIIVTDDGSTITAYLTSSGSTFGPGHSFDNGTGVSADVLTYVQPLETGEVVIYNGLHYQIANSAAFDGTDPATNTTAYTELPKVAGMGYITEVDEIEFDFVPDWLQYRADKRGNRYAYSEDTDTADFALGFTAIDQFQWGRDAAFGHFVAESRFDNLNIQIATSRVELTNFCLFSMNTVNTGGLLSGFALSNGASFINNQINANISAIILNASGFNSCTINASVTQIDISAAALLENKTFNASCSGWSVSTNLTFTETIASAISNITHECGFSNYPQTIDVTGLTTLDLVTVELAGIYTITGGATENINLISNFPTLFPFILRPEVGLTLTVTYTAVGSLSAVDEIVGPTATLILNGDNGDELTLQSATIGGFAVTVQKDANTNI